MIDQLWNKSSFVEAAFFSADIVNNVLQFSCTKTHGKDDGTVEKMPVFEILMLFASVSQVHDVGENSSTRSAVCKIIDTIENKSGKVDTENLDSPFGLILLLESFLSDSIHLAQDVKRQRYANSIETRGNSGGWPKLFHGITGRLNLALYGWYPVANLISSILLKKLAVASTKISESTSVDKAFDEGLQGMLNALRSLYQCIGQTVLPMALIESQNANAKRFTKEISNEENILYEFAKRILKSAKLICSICADNFSNSYGRHLGTTFYNVVIIHFFVGALNSVLNFESKSLISKGIASYEKIFTKLIKFLLTLPEFRRCFLHCDTQFAMVIFSYLVRSYKNWYSGREKS